MLLDRIAHYNGVICGGSTRRANNNEESETKRRGGEKPQKPKRKTRRATVQPSDVDDNTKSTDIEKSLEESENLLPDMEQAHG